MCNLNRPPGGHQERQENDENRLGGIYGDHLKQKRQGMIRFLFQNPQGLGHIDSDTHRQSIKTKKLKYALIKHNVDIVGLSETNRDWRLIPQKETMWACTEGWFEHRRLTTSINELSPRRTATQFGGTLLMATNRTAYSIGTIENDFRKLGRWSSILITGKNQRRLYMAFLPLPRGICRILRK
jgi:hypothetical protein